MQCVSQNILNMLIISTLLLGEQTFKENRLRILFTFNQFRFMSISLYKLNIFPQLANHCRSIRRKKSVQKVVKFNRNVLYVEKSMNHVIFP